LLTVIGARPQFIKAAPVSRFIKNKKEAIRETILHTGQHFDENMSRIFFDQMDIPEPEYNLGISGMSHGAMTGRMLEGIEKIIIDSEPDLLLVYGDTNSTLAGALAACKLGVPVAHVEAGLRSFNMRMPEEINRILTDKVSNIMFCPTGAAVSNLEKEGLTEGVWNVGDVMYDAALFYGDMALDKSDILERLSLREKNYILSTFHRQENTGNASNLKEIVSALATLAEAEPLVLPLHPRSAHALLELGLMDSLSNSKVIVTEPLAYIDMTRLEQSARVIVTDSGGVQKEASFHKVYCVTMRDETEWVETVDNGCNILVGADHNKIIDACKNGRYPAGAMSETFYGSGNAAEKIVEIMAGEN